MSSTRKRVALAAPSSWRWPWLVVGCCSVVLCLALWVLFPSFPVVRIVDNDHKDGGDVHAGGSQDSDARGTGDPRVLDAGSAGRDALHKAIWFPSPTMGFGPSAPFTFNPMYALSAPHSAFSFVEALNGARQLTRQTVGLYAVDHPCTHMQPHVDKLSYDGHWDRQPAPPFVQSLQTTAPGLFLESSGGYNHSFVREFDTGTGKTKRLFRMLGRDFAEGVAALYVAQLQRLLLLVATWESGVVYVLDYDSFECVGSLEVEIEAWGFVSSLDLRLWYSVKQARAHAQPQKQDAHDLTPTNASVAASAQLAEREEKFAADVAKQRLWMTTGGPELLEVSIEPLLASLSAHLSRRAWPSSQPRGGSDVVETAPTPTCAERIGRVELRRSALMHCLGQVLVGLNELEYWPGKHILLANLYGLPVIAMLNPDSGECTGLVSLSGVRAVDQFHDENHRVTNGIAFPFSDIDEHAPWLYFTGKEWPVVVSVRLRRLRQGDSVGLERSVPSRTCPTPRRPGQRYLQVENIGELRRKVPSFFPK